MDSIPDSLLQYRRFLADEAATLQLGTEWAAAVGAPLVVYLQGDLGAGKTTFARGLLRGFGHTGAVKSPTYAIVESYLLAGLTLHHFDLYRFSSPEEWEDAGLDDLISGNSICLIEWPQQGGVYVPPADVTLTLNPQNGGRLALFTAHTELGKRSLQV